MSTHSGIDYSFSQYNNSSNSNRNSSQQQKKSPAPISRKEYLIARVAKKAKEEKLITFCCLVVIPVVANVIANLCTHLIMNFSAIVNSIEKIIF